MHISEIFIENFRTFGSEAEGNHFELHLTPSINVLVGENDSGKTAVIDAIRYVLWTTSQEYHRFYEDDFHVSGNNRAKYLTIRIIFRDLATNESARFLEWLSLENDTPCLYVTLNATRLDAVTVTTRQKRNIFVTVRAGIKAEGRSIEGEIREFLRTTYLKPLRDAEAELSAGRGSRLSQILRAHPNFRDHAENDFDPNNPNQLPRRLTGIMRHAEYHIENNELIADTKETLNAEYLHNFSIAKDVLKSNIGVAKTEELRTILEKLELWLNPQEGIDLRIQRGLGLNNVLFMAAELLLLKGEESSLPLLLIEEPEAHLHPQMQIRLMDFLESRSNDAKNPVQVLVTTHSPNLASKINIENITVLCESKPYSLASKFTKLESSDYRFLRRFLDVTKANLFFAKGVVIVEGDAEYILLPTLAKLIGRSFSENGISVVNVGSVGLFRYSRIFQRKDGLTMPVRVACITDRDIVPDAADYASGKKESEYVEGEIESKLELRKTNDGRPVKTFVSPKWTFEYDLAYSGLESFVHIAIQFGKKSRNKTDALTREEKVRITKDACSKLEAWRRTLNKEIITANIYEPLYKNHASKTETAQFLAEILSRWKIAPNKMRERLPKYLVDAIDYVTGYAEY